MNILPTKPASVAVVLLAACLACPPSTWCGQIIDRVISNVNGHVILQSDWEQELTFEAFSNARDPDSYTSEERKAALDRLIDRELLREQLRPSQPAPAEQVAGRVAGVRKLYPECVSETAWQARLQRYGLTQASLEKRMSDELQIMKLVEDRLRPSIQIDQQAVESYYTDQLLPDLKKSGGREAPLKEVFGRIRDLLAERKMNELLSGWLASLRSGSRILTPESNPGDSNR
jgi:hypothetical protein